MWNSNWNNETINRSNGEDILCMLNVVCWETLDMTLSLQFMNFWFSQMMMMMILIHWCWLTSQLNGFCLFATYKMFFRISFWFLLSIVDIESWFMIEAATMSLNRFWSSTFRNENTLFTLKSRSNYLLLLFVTNQLFA